MSFCWRSVRDWENLLDPEKREIATMAVKTVSELSELVRGAALKRRSQDVTTRPWSTSREVKGAVPS